MVFLRWAGAGSIWLAFAGSPGGRAGQSGAPEPTVTEPAALKATLKLPHLFASGMVLQRDKPIVVWGWAEPKTTVSVSFSGRTSHGTVGSGGEWTVRLPAHAAGGPFNLAVRCGADSVTLADVVVGDVWVASGQSNMEFEVWQSNNAEREIASAHDPELRQFKVPTSWSNSPETDLAGGKWTVADPTHVGAFSAVGYFFARELRKSVGVPIGIINTTWGGSNIETWISRPAQHIDDAAWNQMRRDEDAHMNAIRDSLRTKLGDLPATDVGMVGSRAAWADPSLDDKSWFDVHVPDYWEGQGFSGLDGVGWYRRAFELTAAEVQRGVTIALDAIDDDDITWVNGAEVGRTSGYNVPRSYHVPASALHAGRNVIAVRVNDGGGGGGINGAATLVFGDGSRRSLAGTWKFKVAVVSIQPDGQRINKVPSVLYNKMLHPLLPFPIKGVIWYQGESNANNLAQARAYRRQFTTLIASWRREWDAGGKGGSSHESFPFLWVQLPNYGAADSVPPSDEASAWAAQRESMAAALGIPHTGQAIAIDVGDPTNIHPKNKQDVGDRLARVTRAVVYGEHIVASGPTYRSYVVHHDTVDVEFANVARGLLTTSKDGSVGAFAIAGADRKFVWANAAIVGNRVHVWSDRVAKPVAVRYAWANNPERVNLYNSENLPAAPFRTDHW